jgi:hypothetical protein
MTATGFYHCSAKGVGRANGRSVVAAAAYRSGERLVDGISGQTFDFRARGGVAETFVLTRSDAPAWAHDRERLWNEAERATERSNARIANEFVLGLPHQLNADQRRELVKDFLAPLVEKHGVAVDVAIHEPGEGRDARNHHAHVLVTHRELGPEGFGEIASSRIMTRKRNGEMVQERVSGIIAAVPDVFALRKNWEQAVNRAYERAGLDIRVDHRSHDDRGLDQKPTIHLGPTAAEIERRRPGASELGDINRKITAENDNRQKLAALEAEERKLDAQIIDIKAERAMRDAYAQTPGRYDRLDETHHQVARDQTPGKYDELKAATPPPEIVRQFDANASRTAEPAAPIYDRDADNASWEAKIADAAIGKDARNARLSPADRAGIDVRTETVSPSGGPQNRTAPQDTRPLGKTASEILMAWTLSRSGEQFEEALAAKGISLAVVSREEAEQSQRTAAFAKEVGNFAPTLKAGEIVAVNEYGAVHRFTQRTTGDEAPDIEARFPGIDRAALLNVADAKEVMQDAARAAYKDEARQERDIKAPLTGIETMIADALANTKTGLEFAEALDGAGITIARVTPEDEKALNVLRDDAILAVTVVMTENADIDRDVRHYANVINGDYAAVTRSGDVFRLNPMAFDFEEMEQRLGDVQTRLPSVIEARAQNEINREKTAEFWADLRAWNAGLQTARNDAREGEHALHQTAAAAERVIDGTFGVPGEAIYEGLGGAGRIGEALGRAFDKALGGIFEFFVGAPKLSPMQAELAARAEERLAETRQIAAEEQDKQVTQDEIVFQQDRQQQQEELERQNGRRERPGDREREREREREWP